MSSPPTQSSPPPLSPLSPLSSFLTPSSCWNVFPSHSFLSSSSVPLDLLTCRIERIDFLDEQELLIQLLQHYCLSCGFSDAAKIGEVSLELSPLISPSYIPPSLLSSFIFPSFPPSLHPSYIPSLPLSLHPSSSPSFPSSPSLSLDISLFLPHCVQYLVLNVHSKVTITA